MTLGRARIGASMAAVAATILAAASPARAQQAQPLTVNPVPTTPMPDGFTLAAAGDLIYLRPMLASLERESPELFRILRGADATFGNFETTVVDLPAFKGAPQAESGGTWMLASTQVPGEVKAMGFDLVSQANNHATDWGVEGMAETSARLSEASLIHAGVGHNLSAARAPDYYDSTAGRVALVSATTTFSAMSRASDPYGQAPGRPGVNFLRTTRTIVLPPERMAHLAQAAGEKPDAAEVAFMGVRYRAGAAGSTTSSYSYKLDERDVAANLMSVRQARQNSNFAIYSLHNHEPGNESLIPADFAQDLAHRMIDAGADAYIGHGPHQVRGVEIYKGKPIFYSLGNFAMMNNSLDVVPADMYDQFGVEPGSATIPEFLQARNARQFSDRKLYESVVAVTRYVGGQVAEIRLYPIDLGVSTEGAGKGVPKLADAAVGRAVLERLQTLSKPYGTEIAIERGVGVIRPGR